MKKVLLLSLLASIMFVGCAKVTYNGKEYGVKDITDLGLAAMAYVSHITNHPSLCEFFLKVGVVGAIIAIIVCITTSIAKGVGRNKENN